MTPASGPPPYTVTLLHGVADQLVAWGRAADRIGLGEEYRAALRVINERLSHDPMQWGDPVRDYQQAGLSERWVMHPVLIVHFGVHPASRRVFVRQVRLNPYSRLAGEGAT